MDRPAAEQYEQQIAELASFCFRRLANLEARFSVLCQRAEALGIDCADLCSDDPVRPEDTAPLRVLN
ncbi:MAG: hypothetical protein ACT443_04940 [Gemmatimonadota bacterium]